LASCDEVKVGLQYFRDLEYVSEEMFKDLHEKYRSLGRRILNFIRYLEKKYDKKYNKK
jgi:four helix bundle protein